MKHAHKYRLFLTGMLVSFAMWPPFLYAQLIAPTRTLNGSVQEMGKLSVSSEPPGLVVVLDGKSIGNTPIIGKSVKPGSHVLRVKKVSKEIVVEPGQTIGLSFYKGAFIEVPERKEGPGESEIKYEKPTVESGPMDQPQEKKAHQPPSPVYWPQNPKGPIY